MDILYIYIFIISVIYYYILLFLFANIFEYFLIYIIFKFVVNFNASINI